MENSIIQRLEQLEKEVRIIDPKAKAREELFQPFHDLTEEFLEEIETVNAFKDTKANKELYEISGEPEEITKTIETLREDVFKKGINAASGGHLGYIPGGGIYASSIGDYIAAISNAYSGVYYASPGAVEMEGACLNWLKSVFGFPKSALGSLSSGGSIANLTALAAARDQQKILFDDVSKSVIYMTDQTHHSLAKAINLLGLQFITRRFISTDEWNRMDVEELKNQIQQDKSNGLKPAIIIANAGTTDTGAIDPLNEIAKISQENGLWMHVDAAYGGFFIMADSAKHKFKGIEKADSITCDPHKALFLPYGIGAVLIKNREAVFASNRVHANYMQDKVEEETTVDPADVSPELTKHFRALRMWLPLKIYGTTPFKAGLEEKLLLTEYFRLEVEKLGFHTGPTPDLSVTYFWYPFEEGENEKNQKLMDSCHQDGRVFLSSTLIKEKFVIRMAIVSFRTHKSTIDKTIQMLKSALQSLKD